MAEKLNETQRKQKAGMAIECIRNDAKMRMEIRLDCHEFSWNCPQVNQPDFGRVVITYTPLHKISETKSLKFYLQRYRYANAFNEELAYRILCDFNYYVEPSKIEVVLEQTSRGGIQNTVRVSWDSTNPEDERAWKKLNYVPKKGFQGGFGMLGEKK